MFNCVPVFANTQTTNTINFSSDEDLKEPYRGQISYDNMASSFYKWHKVIATYVWHKDIWRTESWYIDSDEGGKFLEINQVKPYPIQLLPKTGKEGEKIEKTFWIYESDGIKPELVLQTLKELKCKINASNNQNI